jgi:Trypsin-like peptidase domain
MTALASLLLSVLPLTAAELPAVESKSFSRVTQQTVLLATVRIQRKDNECSGVIVRQQGAFVYVLTAAHLVDGAETVSISTYTARSYPMPDKVYDQCQVIGSSRESDLALLRLATRDPIPGVLPLCPAGMALTEKDFAGLTCGVQSGQPPTCWTDTVAGKKLIRKPNGESCHVWELGREPASGRSGGPLIDKRGNVIGIATGRSDGKGYYTHLDEIYRFLKQNDAARPILDGKD